jgi:hypothetical protein
LPDWAISPRYQQTRNIIINSLFTKLMLKP